MSSTPVLPSTPTWKIELNKRIEAFSSAIGVDESKVREILGELGVKDDEQSLTIIDSDEFLPFGDLRQKLVEEHRVTQLARLRMGMPHLRARTTIEEVKETTNGGEIVDALSKIMDMNRPVAKWSDKELLEHLDEEEGEVVKALASKTKGRPCIVFNPDGSVNVPVSLTLVNTAKKQATSRVYEHDGEAVKVRPVGVWPSKPVDESPFYPGIPLVNDYCAKSSIHWKGVDFEARVLVRVYVEHVETGKLNMQNMKDLFRTAAQGKDNFRKEHSLAALVYDELAEKGELPKLKINPNSQVAGKIDTGFGK